MDPTQETTHSSSDKAVFALAIDLLNPKIVYAGGSLGVFKSTDGGVNWTFHNTGFNEVARVHHLAIDPQHPLHLYACTGSDFGGGRIFKSTDGGETWSLILKTSGSSVLVINPHNPAVLYVGIYDVGFLKSADGGAQWTMTGVPPGISSWHIQVTTLAIDPVNPATLYAGAADGGVIKSTDAGATWEIILEAGDNGPVDDVRDFRIYSVNALAIDPTNPTTLYVGTHGRGVLKSTDGGMNWEEVNHGGERYVYALVTPQTTLPVLYTATYDSISRSRDAGREWRRLPFRTPTAGINAIAVNPTGTILYIGTNSGVSTLRLGQ